MVTLTEKFIIKSRLGVYSDTSENRRKHRVGQKYGAEKQPEDGEKTEKKETDPAKELEAVNKVIAAVNEGKLNLPAAEVIKLSEKKKKLEAVKKNEAQKKESEKKDKLEVEETTKKANESHKKTENRGELTNEEKANVTPFGNPELYIQLSKNSEEKKKLIELLKEVGTVEKEETVQTGISGTYKVGNEYFQISGTNVTTGLKKKKGDSQYLGMSGHKRWYGGGKFFEKTDKSEEFSVFDDEKMSALTKKLTKKSSKEPEKKEKPKEESKSEPKQGETEESYTRVKFDDVPNSGKVALKKYLSDKVRNQADENLGVLSKVSFENLQTMEKGLVKEFNSQFGSLSKSRRAEKLYSIMKVKSELENRKQEESKKYQKYTSSLDDNTLLSIGYDLGEEIRKLSSRGFSTLEQQQEVLKKISELSGKRQINEDEQRKRMDKLNNSPDETRANKKGELAKRGNESQKKE